MTFTQNSITQGIGNQYLVQTTLSGDDNQEMEDDDYGGIDMDQDQPIYEMHRYQSDPMRIKEQVSPT